MSKVEIEKNERKLDKLKKVVKKNWKPFTVGVIFTGVTVVVTRKITLRYFPTNVMRINNGGVININNGVSYFTTYARRQGPPSYVIRCVETGQIFTSQAEACRVLGISQREMSRHLNHHPGFETITGNKTWQRKAIAAPATW